MKGQRILKGLKDSFSLLRPIWFLLFVRVTQLVCITHSSTHPSPWNNLFIDFNVIKLGSSYVNIRIYYMKRESWPPMQDIYSSLLKILVRCEHTRRAKELLKILSSLVKTSFVWISAFFLFLTFLESSILSF